MFCRRTRFVIFEIVQKGEKTRFESLLSDAQVRAALPQVRGELATNLLTRPGWSDKQRAWAHYLVKEPPASRDRPTPPPRQYPPAEARPYRASPRAMPPPAAHRKPFGPPRSAPWPRSESSGRGTYVKIKYKIKSKIK